MSSDASERSSISDRLRIAQREASREVEPLHYSLLGVDTIATPSQVGINYFPGKLLLDFVLTVLTVLLNYCS